MMKFDEAEKPLWLFTQKEFDELPDGTVLECIDQTFATKGVDYIDNDTRFGYLAYGVRDPFGHELKNLFLTFMLKK